MTIKWGKYEWPLPNDRVRLNYFIVGIIMLPIYIKFMGTLGEILSFPTSFPTYLYYGLMWILLIGSYRQLLKRITEKVMLATLFVLDYILIIGFLHPMSQQYVWNGDLFSYIIFQPGGLIQSTLFLFIGLAVTEIENLSALLHRWSRIGIFVAALTYALMLLKGISIHYDDMSTAYSICLILCILVARKETGDLKFSLLGAICLILSGTRGPIVCFIAAILFRFVIFEEKLRRKFIGMMLCLLAMVFLFSGSGSYFLSRMGSMLSRFGVEQLRFLDYLNEGMLLDSSGRDQFTQVLLEAIKAQPILGYGFGGDRLILPNGSYAHNIVIEVLISMGIVLGGTFLLWVAYLSMRGFTSKNTSIRRISIGLFCGTVVKLFFSSSFIISKEFFLYLGICMAACTTMTRKRRCSDDEGA